jgi:hypothetical protein
VLLAQRPQPTGQQEPWVVSSTWILSWATI